MDVFVCFVCSVFTLNFPADCQTCSKCSAQIQFREKAKQTVKLLKYFDQGPSRFAVIKISKTEFVNDH